MSKSALAESYQQYKSNPNVETYEAFGAALFKFIKASLVNKYKRNYDKIEDALGEASVRVLEKLDTFRGMPSQFPSWVMTIAFNQAGMLGRRQVVEGVVPVEERDGPIETHKGLDAKLDIEKVMATLLDEDKKIVEAKMEGYGDEDIARGLGITVPAVKMRWSRIREEFRTQLGGDK